MSSAESPSPPDSSCRIPRLTGVPLRGIRTGDITVVVQGPYKAGLTELAVASVGEVLPGARIIVSTWEGTVLPGEIRAAADLILYNTDPGGLDISDLVTRPQLEFHALTRFNLSRHLLSSAAGLDRVETPYAMKLRSDMRLVHDDFLKVFELFAETRGRRQTLDAKVVVGAAWAPRRSFSFIVQDFMWFGRTRDVQRIFDIKLLPPEEDLRRFETPARHRSLLVAEQYILREFFEKTHHIPLQDCLHVSPYLADLTEDLISSNFVCVPTYEYGVEFHQHLAPINRKRPLTWNWLYETSFGEWLTWARRTHGSLPDLPSPLAEAFPDEEAEIAVKDGLVDPLPEGDSRPAKLERVRQRPLLEMGVAAFEAGRIQEAFDAFDLAYQIDERNADACNLYGALLSRAGDHDRAIALLARALAIQPDMAAARTNMETALSRAGRSGEPVGPMVAHARAALQAGRAS